MRSICILLLFLFVAQSVQATPIEDEYLADVTAYCAYIKEKNQAKKNQLLSPDFIMRAQNSTNDYPFQNNIISALSKDLSDLGKAKQIENLMHDECHYYELNQQAKIQVAFALPTIERSALLFKLEQIQIVKNKLDALLNQIKHKIKNQNETLQNYYKIDSLLQKLEDIEQEIKVNLVMKQLPNIKLLGSKALSNQLWLAEKKRQLTRAKLQKLYNWSIQLQTGAQQNLSNNQNQAVQPYVALFLRYNLGSIFSNSNRDKSATHYVHWKNKQITGTQQHLSRFMHSVAMLQKAEQQRLLRLKSNYQKYEVLNKKLKSTQSLRGNHLGQQIDIDRMMLKIEIRYIQYHLQLLQQIR